MTKQKYLQSNTINPAGFCPPYFFACRTAGLFFSQKIIRFFINFSMLRYREAKIFRKKSSRFGFFRHIKYVRKSRRFLI